jgi:hypothetical protein
MLTGSGEIPAPIRKLLRLMATFEMTVDDVRQA